MKADEVVSRGRGVIASQAAQRAARATARPERRCYLCGADISARRKDAWHCGTGVHGPRVWHLRRRRVGQSARLLRRPRCMICDAPLNPKLKGWTCSRACATKRSNWYLRG